MTDKTKWIEDLSAVVNTHISLEGIDTEYISENDFEHLKSDLAKFFQNLLEKETYKAVQAERKIWFEAEQKLLEKEYRYPHMCRDEHEQIGHSSSDEMCPVCRIRGETISKCIEVLKPRIEIHNHNSIPNTIDELEEGCVTCVANNAIYEAIKSLKELH